MKEINEIQELPKCNDPKEIIIDGTKIKLIYKNVDVKIEDLLYQYFSTLRDE